MKGIVFNLFEILIVRDHGEETWEELIDEAGVAGAYTSLGSYADADFEALVRCTSARTGLDADEVVRWYGRNAMPLFAERYPQLFSEHADARSFVLTLNEIIHPEVRKLYPGAIVPEFDFHSAGQNELVMDYSSPRRLCAFAEGLLLGAGDHYGETVEVHQPLCMLQGDQCCRLMISFHR